MSDGDDLILGSNNTADSETDLTWTGGAGVSGLHVQGLDGNAIGGRSAVGVGVEGISYSAAGVAGSSTSDDGVFGKSSGGTGVHGASSSGVGVRGTSFEDSAVEGFSFGSGAGVNAVAPFQNGQGVVAFSANSFGVRGQSGAANVLPPVGGGGNFQKCAVQGSSDDGTGVRGDSAHHVGVHGRSFAGDGVFGSCQDQPDGPKTTGNAIHGRVPRSSPNATIGPFAGRFEGDVTITGNLYVGNRLLVFPWWLRFPMVLAAGIVDLDRRGEAIVRLPRGLSERHTRLTYHLTPVGGPAPNLHVTGQGRSGRFKIAGGASNRKVSWQVSGEPKELPVAVEHPSERPYDPRLARAFRRDAKSLTRSVKRLETQSRRRLKD